MCFFVPNRLVEFEYISSNTNDVEYEELAKDYSKEIEFAFFVVNFNYTKADYEQLTNLEKLFIYKAYENKVIGDTTLIRNAVFNATINANRKKNKKFVEMFKKKSKKVNKETVNNNISIIKEVEQKEGKAWFYKLCLAQGIKS